jgi:lysophospholipase L1-like esterase
MAWFDNVVLDGSAITNQPNLGIVMMHINDVPEVGNTTTWNNDLTTLYNRVHTLCPVGFMSPYEVLHNYLGLDYNTTTQANYRAQTKTTATNLGLTAPVLDFFDAWSGLGYTDNDSTYAAGFLYTDHIHESQAGHLNMAPRVYWWLRSNFLSSYSSVPSQYTATGKIAAVQFSAKQASVQYSAGSIISI